MHQLTNGEGFHAKPVARVTKVSWFEAHGWCFCRSLRFVHFAVGGFVAGVAPRAACRPMLLNKPAPSSPSRGPHRRPNRALPRLHSAATSAALARASICRGGGCEFKCGEWRRAQGGIIYRTQRGASAKTIQNAHSGAPALRRKATTSELSRAMAVLRGVRPLLQRSAWVGSTTAHAHTAGKFAAPVPRGDVRFGVDEEFCNFCITSNSRLV